MYNQNMRILAIETSCDETAAALLEVKGGKFNMLSNVVSSQVKIHAKYGGIVPEVAARKQIEMVLPVVHEALSMGSLNEKTSKRGGRGMRNEKLEIKNQVSQFLISNFCIPDYIAVTHGPGLITSLRVGVETARTLSYIWNKPLVAVNHLEGHIYASAIFNNQFPISKKFPNYKLQITNYFPVPKWKFPVLALVVSGGHTQLVLMRDHLKYKIIGETLDDAAGEAFDKVAKILDLGYPGGPIISKTALNGDPKAFDLPRPMLHSGDFNFSFSGLKTAVLYLTQKHKNTKTQKHKSNVCASFQQAVIDVLVKKTIKAAEEHGVKTIILGGGVAANPELRQQLGKAIKDNSLITNYQLPITAFSGDNAAMIAVAAYFNIKHRRLTPWQKVRVDANLRLK